MGLTEREDDNIFLARLIMGTISLICSSTVLGVYFYFKELRYFFMRQVIYMISVDMVRSFGLMLLPTTKQPVTSKGFYWSSVCPAAFSDL